MKTDGDTMETPEPTEAAAVAESSSSQDNITEQAPSQPEEAASEAAPMAAPMAAPKADSKPVAAKVKLKAVTTKLQPVAKPAGASGSQPGAASHRTVNGGFCWSFSRPATGPSTSRPFSTTSTVKPPANATAKITASRVTTAPSTGRTAAAQPPKAVAAKKAPASKAVESTTPKPSTSTTAKAGAAGASKTTSETSTPEELCDSGKPQPRDVRAPAPSPQPELDREGGEEAEARTLPADEVLGGPATSPTSNPSSTSVTDDEASDTEGEALLDDSLESPALGHVTFDL